MSHQAFWKASVHLICNAAFSSSINPHSPTHLLSSACSLSLFLNFNLVTKLYCSSVKTALIYALFYITASEKKTTLTGIFYFLIKVRIYTAENDQLDFKQMMAILSHKTAFLILKSAWCALLRVKLVLKVGVRGITAYMNTPSIGTSEKS